MRLTEKDKQENHYSIKPINMDVAFDFESIIKAYDKLGQLEDIEDDFGIDLVILFKTKTVWCKTLVENKQTKEQSYQIIERNLWGINLEYKEIMVGSEYSFGSHKIKDYGITWALTREELE